MTKNVETIFNLLCNLSCTEENIVFSLNLFIVPGPQEIIQYGIWLHLRKSGALALGIWTSPDSYMDSCLLLLQIYNSSRSLFSSLLSLSLLRHWVFEVNFTTQTPSDPHTPEVPCIPTALRHTVAPQAPCQPTGKRPKEPRGPTDCGAEALHNRKKISLRGDGGWSLGIQLQNMLHWINVVLGWL